MIDIVYSIMELAFVQKQPFYVHRIHRWIMPYKGRFHIHDENGGQWN